MMDIHFKWLITGYFWCVTHFSCNFCDRNRRLFVRFYVFSFFFIILLNADLCKNIMLYHLNISMVFVSFTKKMYVFYELRLFLCLYVCLCIKDISLLFSLIYQLQNRTMLKSSWTESEWVFRMYKKKNMKRFYILLSTSKYGTRQEVLF